MTHEEKVARIVAAIKARPDRATLSFRKATVSHKVPKREARLPDRQEIDVSDLDEILDIDTRDMTCTAEPGVTFVDLVRKTLALGLVPCTVPELKTITIGGAVAGCSVESMSFKYGGFHDSCLEYEVITAGGEILGCRKGGENSLVFEMAHGTFGTLGLITKLRFRLLPAKPFVRLDYEKYSDYDAFAKAMRGKMEQGGADFMDGIVISPKEFVLCLGTFVDRAPYAHNYDWMSVYHRSVAERSQDYLRTFDYFFRYDADCHWIVRNYGLENRILRFVFGRFFLSSTRVLSLAKVLTRVQNPPRPDVIVDLFVPDSNGGRFFDFYAKTFDYYPLWVVPYHIANPYPWISSLHVPPDSETMFIDFAVYGFRQRGTANYYRLLEEKLAELGGIKTLISHNFYERDEFWKIWNEDNYGEVKRLVDPDNAFRDLYDKTHGRA